MRETFIEKNFAPSSLAVIGRAERILREYAVQGFDLSLRQLYYQFVARGLLENSQQNYKRLGSIINDARLAGLIDWDYIKDRGRETQAVSHWDSPAEILVAAANSFHIDKWEDQDCCVLVKADLAKGEITLSFVVPLEDQDDAEKLAIYVGKEGSALDLDIGPHQPPLFDVKQPAGVDGKSAAAGEEDEEQ